MAAKPKVRKPVPAVNKDGDARALAAFQHHKAMADKHRAHADLIRARLGTQGKEIDEYGSYAAGPSAPDRKPRIVKKRM